jgi:2-dehydropantoate 2-reductase
VLALGQFAAVFKQAGFSVKLSPDMQTWLKTHAIMEMSIIIAAVMMTGGARSLRGRARRTSH